MDEQGTLSSQRGQLLPRNSDFAPIREQDRAARSNASFFLFFTAEDEKKKKKKEEEKKKRISWHFLADGIRKNRILEFLNACSIHKIFIDRTAIVKKKLIRYAKYTTK